MFEAAGAFIAAILKVGVPIYIAALIASGLFLFLPDFMAQNLGISAVRQLYRPYIGGTFVISMSLLVAYGLSAISDRVKKRLTDRRSRLQILKTLSALTVEEKQFLNMFIMDGRNTVHAPISDGIAGGLVAKRIIYRSSRIFHMLSAPYNLQPIACKLLTDHPELLD